MKTRAYLNFNGNCAEAVRLYEEAFDATIDNIMHYGDLPANPDFPLTEEMADMILHCTIYIGDDFIRMSDCPDSQNLNVSDTEKIALSMEGTVEEVRTAFDVLSRDGKVGIELCETFFSPLHGVVYDKFGIMWNLVAEKTK